MFCVNCGKEIKDQAVFCPFCGQTTAASHIAVRDSSFGEDKKRKIVFGAAGIFIIIMLVLFIIVLTSGSHKYSVIGKWKCDELTELDEIAGEILRQNGVDDRVAELVQGLLQAGSENFYVTFTDSREMYFSVYGVSTSSLGSICWEQLSDKEIKLDYTLEIPVYRVPLNLSFTIGYELKKDSLTLSIYGYELHFTRVE